MKFKTILSSANFALNCSEGDPAALAKLFPGMTVETAKNILERGRGLCRQSASTEIDVPDHLCDQQPAATTEPPKET